MPELPEVEALARFLDRQVAGLRVVRCELASFAALKTVGRLDQTLVGRTARGCRRRGKQLCLEVEGTWLVLHLARGGWVRWYERVPEAPARPSRGPLALRVGFAPPAASAPAAGFDVTEAGTEKRLALWAVASPEAVPSIAALGIDPLDPGFDAPTLARLLAGAEGTVKTALTTPSVLAGVGNAYSDEALHAARVSPFKPASRLGTAEVEALWRALVDILTAAVAAADGRPPDALKDEKARALRVHGRGGEPCPVCGDVIRSVWSATRSLQYCATCQTAGRPLADRRLSRLVR